MKGAGGSPLKHLEKSAVKLEDILTVEKELSECGEIR
jgi:hypothetical protein